jgi:hypothetical protein
MVVDLDCYGDHRHQPHLLGVNYLFAIQASPLLEADAQRQCQSYIFPLFHSRQSINPDQSSYDSVLFDHLEGRILGRDGIVVLQLLAKNAGEVMCAHVVKALWDEVGYNNAK